MLEIGKPNEVKFKVSVNGTSATPAVRLVIEAPDAELGFTCNQGDGYWFTSVNLPEDLRADQYPFRVEVVVNNKLFTPVRKTVLCARASEIAAEGQTPATPTQTPDQTREWEGEGGALKKTPEEPKPLPPEKVQPVEPVKESASIRKLANLMKEVATDKKPPPKVRNLQPEPAKTRTPKKEPTRINIAEIVADSNKRFDKVLRESASYRKPGKAATPINLNIGVPVSLKREEIVYE